MNSLYKVIITYELIFLLFWNILYLSNSDIENWFTEKFLTAIFVFLSTMALGATLVYIIFISLKLTGISKILKNVKNRKSVQKRSLKNCQKIFLFCQKSYKSNNNGPKMILFC